MFSISKSYVIPNSERILFRSISFALIQKIISRSFFKLRNMLIFASGLNPGKTLAAWLSENSFPPTSKYSLSNILNLSLIFAL